MLGQHEVGAVLTDDEKALFAAKARENGMSRSDYLRVLIRRDAGLADENRAATFQRQKKAKILPGSGQLLTGTD